MRATGLAAAMMTVLATTGAAAADTMKVLPGEWEITSTMKMLALPNVPPQVAAMLAKQQGKPVVMRTCLTPEDVARGPESRPRQAGCTMSSTSYGGGRMASETVCKRGGEVSRIKMAGSYTPTSYVMDGQMSGAGKDGGMAMNMHVAGRRVAAVCSSKSK